MSWHRVGTTGSKHSLARMATVALLLGVGEQADPQCPNCRIQTRDLVAVGDKGAGEILGDPSSVAVDSRGRVFITVPWSRPPQLPLVFGAEGQLLQQIGSVGAGPNEYRQPVAILVGPDDTVFVADQRQARLTVLSASLHLVRTVPIPEARDVIRLTNGDWVVRSEVGVPGSTRLSATGVAISTYRDSGEVCSGWQHCTLQRRRLLAPSPDGGFWSVRRHFRYELIFRSSSGALSRPIHPATDWFPSYEVVSKPQDGKPEPFVAGLWVDSAGLWVVGNAPTENRRTAQPNARGAFIRDIHDLMDGVIDLLDPRDGSVLAHLRIPAAIAGVARPGVIFTFTQDADGFRHVRLHTVSLLR
jgi:hypothetical protein